MPTPNLPYKGSPHHRPKPNYPSPTVARGIRPEQLTHETCQPYLPQSSTTAQLQRQRRISRNQHGLRVSRRLPTKTSRGSLPTADSQSPLSQAPQSPSHPYWGTLQSPTKTDKTSKASRAVDNHTASTRSKEIPNTSPARDKMLSGAESTTAKRQGRKTPKREKRFGVADPLAWDVLNRSLSQQRRLSSLINQDGPIAMPAPQSAKKTPDGVSRTSSQRRALNRFARELEKYADVAGTVVPVITPTISESKVSLHTVKPLVPYKDEFLAAGLAVTSTEQNRNGKAHAHVSAQDNRPHKHMNGPPQTRKKLDPLVDGPPSGASASTPCTSLESYVDFSPPGGHMLHAIESLVPRKNHAKSRHCPHTRRRLLSWFLKKPSSKVCTANGHHPPVRIQHVKGGQIKPRDLSVTHHEHHGIQHRSHRPTMQSIPEIQLWPRPALPEKYVTPKKEPYIALISDYYEPRDQGHHHTEQEDGHSHSFGDAKQSLGRFGLQGKRDITRGVLPQPYPEPIETIDEETEISTHPVGNNAQNHRPDRLDQKELPSITQCARQRPDAVSSVTHESSAPSLPFAARLAVSTSSSLQRALDDACQKLDIEERKGCNPPEQENTKLELPPLPRQDSQHSACHHALPRKPRSTEKFIYVKRNMPTVEPLPLTSKPLPPEPVPVTQAAPKKRSDAELSQPSRKAPPPPPPPRALTGKRKNAVAELAKAEEMLKDLDVFLSDYDDADIQDRDVIKGLQVAIHAAADDLYDGYIRHKTGLRIRRFLADLKSFEDISELSSTEQRAKERSTKGKRPVGVGDVNKHG